MHDALQAILHHKHRTQLPNVLIAAAECSPLSKTGGLADVVGALPKSLAKLGFDARVITPYHRCIKEKYADKIEHIWSFDLRLGWRTQYVGLEKTVIDGVTVYLIDNEYYFGDAIYRGGLAEGEQYCYFQRAVLECIPFLDFKPEVLHCNDWHTAMLPFLIKTQYQGQAQGALGTVLTIHNLAFQGWFGFDFVSDMLSVDRRWYTPEYIQHFDCVNFLKSGCVFADRITTVSPNYMREIQTREYGEGLEDVLRWRSSDLSGIINGIDTAVFNPETDPNLVRCYSAATVSEGKRENKTALLNELGLNADADTPVIAMVSRLTAQKGIKLVLSQADAILDAGAVLIVLGSGDSGFEDAMRDIENRHRGRMCAYIGYSEPLARRIYAGADFLLMPSLFEPCGLSQMIAQHYGTLPIVRETGGLRDTVNPYNRYTGSGDGFSFAEADGGVMLGVVRYALETYQDKPAMSRLIAEAMSRSCGFDGPALEYGKLFAAVCHGAPLSAWAGRASHTPWNEDCRKPLGAVRCGESVTLRIEAEKEITEAELVIDGESVAMTCHGPVWEATVTAAAEPTVEWYYFRLNGEVLLGADGVSFDRVKAFQLTVWDAAFSTPEWAKGAVMYQIFPDRFCRKGSAPTKGAAYHRSLGRSVEMHKRWDEPVKSNGKNGMYYYPDDFYGGTLSGIASRLPELKAMGVDCIYLNPVFESDSNHRYNTADYLKIDPILGTNAAFKKLCAEAKKLGMRVIIDGVFSHTGDDSVYFDRRGVYGGGACSGETSPYYKWYDFKDFPDDYRCWWGFRSLPEVNECDPDWQNFVIDGDNSVIKTWLRAGASGYRLDVADELPDGVIAKMRSAIKSEGENLLIGEVWEDATTKFSYGSRRAFALGLELDSVMNYPLRNSVLAFALGGIDAGELCQFLVEQKLNYPQPMYHCLMNMLGSHDTARLRTVLSLGMDGSGLTREQQAELEVPEDKNERGRRLQRVCAAIQFTLPGMPSVYYGDEEGMQGFRDPFCRGPYEQKEGELRGYYAALASARHGSTALMHGDAAFCAPTPDVVCILRFDGQTTALCAVNRSENEVTIVPRAADFIGAARSELGRLPLMPRMTLGGTDVMLAAETNGEWTELELGV
ncbi:MAG: glycogen/starch synthase [Oscillospiraceae bacterium]|nr:glycogen/starch synthase [Oscillospiraceae bacterium]